MVLAAEAEGFAVDDLLAEEVAFLLGFSEQSSFHRAFRRWTGVAPGRWREGASLG